MFGNSDDNQNQKETTTIQPTADPAVTVQSFTPPPADPSADTSSTDDLTETIVEPAPSDTPDTTPTAENLEQLDTTTLPGNLTMSEPVTDDSAAPESPTTAPTPSADNTLDLPSAEDTTTVPTESIPSDLLDIKQEALQELSPLVDHLDQTPEERFRTTMMMIQAADDSSKIKVAYDAAHEIEDKKVRAQALLDVINEINYFTQQQKQAENEQ